MIIVFEGLDKSGKTTLMRQLHKETDFEHVLIDRGPWSNMVYDLLIHQFSLPPAKTCKRFAGHAMDAMRFVKCTDLVVYCKANYDDCMSRHRAAGEEPISHLSEKSKYYDSLSMYDAMIEACALPFTKVLTLDTSSSSMSTCLNRILSYIEG